MQKKNNKETMKRVLKYIRKDTPALVLSLLLAGLTVLLTLYIPILTGNAVDLIIGKGQVDMAGIFAIMKKIAIAMIITAVGQWVMNTCNNYITYHVIRDIRTDAFAKLEILPLKYLDAHAYGDIVSRVIADVDTFADGLLMGFTQLFTGALTILCTLGFMLVTNVPITLVVVCITPVSFLVAKFIATKTYSMFKEQSETRGEQTSLIEEMIDNQKIVNTFSRGEAVKSKFGEINGRLQKCSLKAIFFSSITNPATRFVNSLVYAGVGVFGALVAIKGGISVGRLSCFLSYANQYTKPFNEISGVVTELQNALACAGRVFELIDEPAQTPDPADAEKIEKYIETKVDGNLKKLHEDRMLRELMSYDTLRINGVEYKNLPALDWMFDHDRLRNLFAKDPVGTIHGDLTIENIICRTDNDSWYLIDPNTGNLHESPFLDYGKLLQSLHGSYEFMMKTPRVAVQDNRIDFQLTRSAAYDALLAAVMEDLSARYPREQVESILMHEVIHWLRLMPYKLNKDRKRAAMFYAGLVMVANDVADFSEHKKETLC